MKAIQLPLEYQETADRVEILELLHRHQIYIDLKDTDGFVGLYAPGGTFESPFGQAHGTLELLEMFRSLQVTAFKAGKRHMTGPTLVDLHGDEATALSYWWVAETHGGASVESTGTYQDRLRKIGGRWKIVHRTQTLDRGSVRKQDVAPTAGLT